MSIICIVCIMCIMYIMYIICIISKLHICVMWMAPCHSIPPGARR